MNPGAVAVLLGALGAAALLCLLLVVLHPAPVNVAAALAELDDRTRRQADGVSPRSRWSSRVQLAAAQASRSANPWWGIPTADLDMLDRTAEHYLLRRLFWAGTATVVVIVLALLAWLAGIDLSTAVTGLALLVAAVAGSMVPVLAVKEDATRARDEFRRATATYLDLVAQERATGRAPSQALDEAASVSDSWVFARIRRTLGRALHAGHTPWEALALLGKRMGVAELADLADILAAAADGAAIYTTLLAKSSALRAAALAADKADANSRSQRLALPVALLLTAFLLLVLYPAMLRLLGSGA
ncbi:hypothetical protein GCM10022222_86100 [Amycolatopsis ultiminotia]|uniref:Type II secretion system protein GspF domain-containing protein n=1 Tax=Amycolatopsis ultiminotia TaxID=543629 RepID=A0ABP6YSW2_9PSEU